MNEKTWTSCDNLLCFHYRYQYKSRYLLIRHLIRGLTSNNASVHLCGYISCRKNVQNITLGFGPGGLNTYAGHKNVRLILTLINPAEPGEEKMAVSLCDCGSISQLVYHGVTGTQTTLHCYSFQSINLMMLLFRQINSSLRWTKLGMLDISSDNHWSILLMMPYSFQCENILRQINLHIL